jgi:hypothetical protein
MAPLKEHRDLALQQQIDLLSDYIRETVIDHITKAIAGLVKLDSRIDEAKVFAERKAAEAYDKATSVARRSKSSTEHPSTPAAPLFALTFSQASCTSPLRNIERLA